MSPATYPRRPERGTAAERAAAERAAAKRPRAPLPSNWRRRRPARSPRPAGEPRAGWRAVRLGPARGRVCNRAPGSVLARVRGAPGAPRRLVLGPSGAPRCWDAAHPGEPRQAWALLRSPPREGSALGPERRAGAVLWEAGPPRGGPGRRVKSAAAWRLAGASRCRSCC